MIARGKGWLSIGVGLVALVVPPSISGLVGYVETPALLRLVGVRDLCIGAGLLRPGNGRRWLWARGLRWPGRDDHSRQPAERQHVTGAGHGRDDGVVKLQPVRLAPGAATSMTPCTLVQTCYYKDIDLTTRGQ
jgi:hypothetical protein